MEKILKFGIYDQLGYLLVGAVAEVVVYIDLLAQHANLTYVTNMNLLILTVMAFFIGHLSQAIANVAQVAYRKLINHQPREFENPQKEVLDRVIGKYGLMTDQYAEAFAICLMLTKWKDLTGEVGAFNANYGLYRGWVVVFSLNMLYGLVFVVAGDKLLGLSISSLSLIVAFVFAIRAKRFYGYTTQKVLHTFQLLDAQQRDEPSS